MTTTMAEPAKAQSLGVRAVIRRATKWLLPLTVLNSVGVLVLLVLLCIISEEWWISAALGYLPRLPFLVPSVVLAIATLLTRRRLLAIVNLLCAVVVAGPVMGLSAPVAGAPPPPADGSILTIVSCNVQQGTGDLRKIMDELDALKPDIVALQETKWGVERLEAYFADWNTIHVGEFWVSTRFPLRLVEECESDAFDRTSAALFEIDTPRGTIVLCDVHLNTARHGLTDLRWHSVLSGEGVDEFEWYQWQRRLEAEETLEFVQARAERPVIVLGDFNSPTGSNLFADVWGGLTSAFETAGWGYGYTVPCNTDRLWPAHTPWLRIDHILCDDSWRVHECAIGRSDGSDHRLIWARVSRRPSAP